MPEGQVVHKTETPVTVESLQADFETLGIEKGTSICLTCSFVLERDGMGVWRSRCCHHCASGSIGGNGNTCEHSPLARIYDLHGSVLLLGVGHSNNTSIHLAEYRADFPTKGVVREGAPISQAGSRVWRTFENIDVDASDFDRIGEDFLRSDTGKVVRQGKVGITNCQLMPQRTIVDFAVDWLEKNRT